MCVVLHKSLSTIKPSKRHLLIGGRHGLHTNRLRVTVLTTAALGLLSLHCNLGILRTLTAVLLFLRLFLTVRRLLAYQCALGLGAVGRTVALPIANRLLTDTLALGLGVRALSVAERILTYRITLRTSSDLAVFHGASYLALRLVAFNLTLGASEFLASRGALGRLTHGLTYLITHRLVTLPLALGMTVIPVPTITTWISTSACSKSALFLFRRLFGVCWCEKEKKPRKI